MAVRRRRPAAVMHSYAEIDGVPVAADPALLTGLLRDRWGFDGTVVADYFGVAFLHLLHHVAADLADAAGQALTRRRRRRTADRQRLPGPAARRRSSAARVDVALVDRAVQRVLRQKLELGLLDATFDAEPPPAVDLDSPEHAGGRPPSWPSSRSILLANDGTSCRCPAGRRSRSSARTPTRPRRSWATTRSSTTSTSSPGRRPGIQVPTVLDAAARRVPAADARSRLRRAAATWSTDDRPGIRGGRRGRRADARRGRPRRRRPRRAVRPRHGRRRLRPRRPGAARRPARPRRRRSWHTGTPTSWCWSPVGRTRSAGRVAALRGGGAGVLPGRGGRRPAIAGVLCGRVNPSGRLPVSVPGSAGAQPYSYLHPRLGGATRSTIDPAPL